MSLNFLRPASCMAASLPSLYLLCNCVSELSRHTPKHAAQAPTQCAVWHRYLHNKIGMNCHYDSSLILSVRNETRTHTSESSLPPQSSASTNSAIRTINTFVKENLSEKRDSNPRPRPWQGRALPTELFSHFNHVPIDSKHACFVLRVQS